MVSVLALLVMGPERLPGAIRTGSLWLAKIRRSFADMKQEIENEVGINPDQINLQLHNERVLKSIEENKKLFQENMESLKPGLDELEEGIRDFADYAASEATPPPSSKAGQRVQQAKETAEANTRADQQGEEASIEPASAETDIDTNSNSEKPADTEPKDSDKPL